MSLELRQIAVEDISFSEQNECYAKHLLFNSQSLSEFLEDKDDRIQSVVVHLAKPNEATRIICVKDVVEPRCKITGTSKGQGQALILKNVAVVTCGQIVGFQEGIIDMSGPAAAYNPFSKNLNVVLEINVVQGISQYDHEQTIRNAGFFAAEYLARIAVDAEPDKVETISELEPTAVDQDLPRIAYVYLLLSQGLLHDTYVLGRHAKEGLPCSLSLPVLMDDAIISGNCVSACDKNTTWHHQNNPVLQQLMQAHNKDLNFVGTVLSNLPIRLASKKESADQAEQLVNSLQPQGVIISKEGFGNPDADLMMLIHKLENAGVKTVAITDEFAGPNGASQSLADNTPEADAIISTGNANQKIVLPPMQKTIGPVQHLASLSGAYPQSLRQDGSIEIELQGIIGATNEMGSNTLSCKGV